jgi:hypothetical protein
MATLHCTCRERGGGGAHAKSGVAVAGQQEARQQHAARVRVVLFDAVRRREAGLARPNRTPDAGGRSEGSGVGRMGACSTLV